METNPVHESAYVELQEIPPAEIPSFAVDLERAPTWLGRTATCCKDFKEIVVHIKAQDALKAIGAGILLGGLSGAITLPMHIRHSGENRVIALIEDIAGVIVPIGIQYVAMKKLGHQIEAITMAVENLAGAVTGITAVNVGKGLTTYFCVEYVKIIAMGSGAAVIVGAPIEMMMGACRRRRAHNPAVN